MKRRAVIAGVAALPFMKQRSEPVGFQTPQPLAGASPQLLTATNAVTAGPSATSSVVLNPGVPFRVWGAWLSGIIQGTPSATVSAVFQLTDSSGHVYLEVELGLVSGVAGVEHETLPAVLPGSIALAAGSKVLVSVNGFGAITGAASFGRGGVYYSIP